MQNFIFCTVSVPLINLFIDNLFHISYIFTVAKQLKLCICCTLDFSFVTDKNPVVLENCGTPGMLAPEQTTRASYNPFVSDIWQIGLTLYKMLTNSVPYESVKKGALLEEIKHLKNAYKNVPFPRNKMISPECKGLIAGMLTIGVTERYSVADIEQSSWFKVSGP